MKTSEYITSWRTLYALFMAVAPVDRGRGSLPEVIARSLQTSGVVFPGREKHTTYMEHDDSGVRMEHNGTVFAIAPHMLPTDRYRNQDIRVQVIEWWSRGSQY